MRRTQQVPRLTIHSSEHQGSPQEASSTCMSTSLPPPPRVPISLAFAVVTTVPSAGSFVL